MFANQCSDSYSSLVQLAILTSSTSLNEKLCVYYSSLRSQSCYKTDTTTITTIVICESFDPSRDKRETKRDRGETKRDKDREKKSAQKH